MEFDTRWLEFGVSSALLVCVIIYLLKSHIPQLIKTFDQGLTRISGALKEVNTQLIVLLRRVDHLEERLTDKADAAWRDHTKECRDVSKEAANRGEDIMDQIREQTGELAKELREMKQAVHKLLEAISKIL